MENQKKRVSKGRKRGKRRAAAGPPPTTVIECIETDGKGAVQHNVFSETNKRVRIGSITCKGGSVQYNVF